MLEPVLAATKSWMPSPLKSPTTTDLGLVPTVTSGTTGDIKPPLPFPNRIETVSVRLFAATARSCILSPLKSPIAIDSGPNGTVTSGTAGDTKPPLPFPNRIDTLFEIRFATAMS